MKTILSILILLSAAMNLPAPVGSSYNPSPTLRGINRQVWIAMRTDGRPGTGTADDPFDGSTAAKFDVAFSNAVSASASVHLGPGTFLTAGHAFPAFRFPLVGGAWKIQGAGIDVTTIKLSSGTVTSSNATHYVIGQHANDVPAGQTPEFIELAGLTVDANSANQFSVTNSPPLPCTISAIYLGARRTFVHHVRITGTAGITNECFGLSLAAPNVTNSVHVVEACVADGLTGYQTAINIAGTSATNHVAGVVRDCVVQGSGSTIAGEGQNGFGTWDATGVQFVNNFAQGVVVGFVCDTSSNTNIAFRANRVAAPYGWGVVINGSGTYDGVEITDNWFGASPSSVAILTAASPPADLRVWGNRFDSDSAGIVESTSAGGVFDTNQFLLGTDGRLAIKTNASLVSPNVSGTLLAANLTVAQTTEFYGAVNFPALSTNSILYLNNGFGAAAVTIGSGLSFSGGTLSATGGSGGATNTFNTDQFALVNGTNVNVKSNPLLTNLFSQGWLLIGETNFTPGATEGLMVQDNARAAVRMKNTSASGRDVKIESGTTGQAAVGLYDFTLGGAALLSFSDGGTVSLRSGSGIPAGLTDNGMILGDSASNPTANPTNSVAIWSGSSDGLKYRTAVASEGAGANNRVHNRTAQVTCYDTNGPGIVLTTTMTNVVFSETGPLKITLPTAGTYDLLSQLEVYDNGTSFIQFWAQLWASNSVTQGVVPYSEIYEDLNFGMGSTYTRIATGTFTCTNATDIYVQCKEGSGVPGTQLRTNRTKLRYIRLY